MNEAILTDKEYREKNHRRLQLIGIRRTRGLTAAEQTEFETLQMLTAAWVRKKHPRDVASPEAVQADLVPRNDK